jgi:hypothetical protein
MENHMKNYKAFLFFIVTLTLFSCREKETVIIQPIDSQTIHRGYDAPREIVVHFVDTVTHAKAELFVHELGLIPIYFPSYENNPLHFCIIGVPTGMEQLWIDSLNTYRSYIKDASRLTFVEESYVPPNQALKLTE